MITVESVINQTHHSIHLRVGWKVCPNAHAIVNWNNRKESKYFRNPETLQEAICKAWLTGNYKQKRIILLEIDREG